MVMPHPDRATTVLLVDGDPTSRRELAGALAAAGYDCAQAADPAHGRARLGDGQDVGVLVCEVSDPAAAALVEHVHADLPDIAVVVLAACDDPDAARLALNNAYGYLVK